jgi:hypothetical protein
VPQTGPPRQDAGRDPWWSPGGRSGVVTDGPGAPAPRAAGESFAPATSVDSDPDGEPLVDRDPAADPAAERTVALTRTGRPARAPRPAALAPARAVVGALVAVAGVLLGIGALLWATGGLEAPAGDPTVRSPASVTAEQPAAGPDDAVLPFDEPAVPEPEELAAPVPEPQPEPVPEPVAAAPAIETPLLVLNNSRIPGLADTAARRFEAGGWPVRETGNLRGRIRATTVYYPPGEQEVARELARRFPGIARVLPRLPNLPGSGLTVVVTRDFPT